MPFQKRHVKPRENLTQLYETNKPEKVLTGVFMSNMIEMLRQLGELSSYSCEIFDDLTGACDVVGHRCSRLAQRVDHLGRALPLVEQVLDAHPPEVFFKTPHTRVWTRWDSLSGNVIDPALRPKALTARREAVATAPPLSTFQIPGQPVLTCSNGYSNPNFFVEQWIEAEAEKQAQAAAERKERKKKRKKKKKKTLQQKRQKVAAVKVKTYDARGAEFGSSAEKEVEAVLAVPDTMDVPLSSLLQSLPAPDPGTTRPIYELLTQFTETAYDRHAAAQALVVDRVSAPQQPQQQPQQPPQQAQQQQQQQAAPAAQYQPSAAPSGPPPSGPPTGYAPPPSAAIPGPPPSMPPQQPPAQAGVPGPPSGPPPGSYAPPPGPPAGGVAPPGPPAGGPPPPAAPAIPAAPPIGAVRPPAAARARIPTAPGVPMAAPAIPMAPAAPALAASPSSSDSIMAGIRGGLKLKKVEPVAPKVDTRNVLMTAIRSGAAGLKKLDRAALQQEKEQKLQKGGNSIYDILARRAAIAADSDEESDDDSEWESD